MAEIVRKFGLTAETSFQLLMQEMVDMDLEAARRNTVAGREGLKTYDHHE